MALFKRSGGLKSDPDAFDRKQRLTINFIRITLLAIGISFLPDVYYQIWENVAFAAVAILYVLGLLFIVKRGNLNLGIFLLSLFANFTIFFYAAIHGKAADTHLFYIPIILAYPFVFTLNNKPFVIFNILLSGTLWVCLELFAFDWFPSMQPSAELIAVYQYFNTSIMIITLVFFSFEVLRANEKYRKNSEQVNQLLNDSLELKSKLLKELHHRVKNNLQLISSLLYIKSLSSDSGELRDFIRETDTRIKSISAIHSQLLKFEETDLIALKGYLLDLAQNIVNAHAADPKLYPIHANIDDHQIHIDKLLVLGLMTNEIISNILKHAYPQADGGPIYIDYQITQEQATFSIYDQGKSMPEIVAKKDTYGLSLIQLFSSQLNGKLSVDLEEGVRYTLTFQLNN